MKNPRIAIVHDELVRRGGAERTLEEIIRIFPDAQVFTLYAGKPEIIVDGVSHPVNTTFLQKFPKWFKRHPKRLLPLLPFAAEQMDLSSYDVVISSASAFAKSIITRSHVPHVCFCHTPTRYLWDSNKEVLNQAPVGTKTIARLVFHFLRLADFAAAQRIDHFIANSKWTQERISTYYRKESEIIYPPVDTNYFYPKKVERQHFLCVGRLTPSKKFDQAIDICAKLNLKLVIVGGGMLEKDLKKKARNTNVTIKGRVDRAKLRELYRSAFALLQPGEEDFGIATAEALACGTPVIAYGLGGASEIVTNNETGILYEEQRPEFLAEALRNFLDQPNQFSASSMQQAALKFSRYQFQTALKSAVEKATHQQ